MTDLEAKETIEAMHETVLRDKESLLLRAEELRADYAKDPWEETAAQINRLENRAVVRGLHAEALAIALTKF